MLPSRCQVGGVDQLAAWGGMRGTHLVNRAQQSVLLLTAVGKVQRESQGPPTALCAAKPFSLEHVRTRHQPCRQPLLQRRPRAGSTAVNETGSVPALMEPAACWPKQTVNTGSHKCVLNHSCDKCYEGETQCVGRV